MFGKFGGHVEHAAARRGDHQPPRVKVHLAADRAGQECFGPAVLAVAHDRVADRRHVDAQLVRSPGHRLQFDPGGAVAGTVDHPVASARALPFAAFVDHHLFAAAARLFAQRQFDQAVLDIGHPDHQRPINLARRTAGKMLGIECRAARAARDQQHARGVFVEPVDQPRARFVVLHIGIEQPVDMFERAAAALRRQSRRLVQHERTERRLDHHILRQIKLRLAQRFAGARALGGRRIAARRHAQRLPRHQPVGHIGAFAVDPDLPGARPAADHRKADQRHMALEPAIQPNPVIIGRDGELADDLAHAAARVMARPANSAASPASTDSAA